MNELFDESLIRNMLKSFKVLNSNEQGVFTELSFLGRDYALKHNGFSKKKTKLIQEEYKFCPKCEERKPLSMFGKRSESPDGKQSYCKACMRKYVENKRSKKGQGKRKYSHHNNRGEKLARYNGYIVRSKDVKDVIDKFGDGKPHKASEIKKLFKEYYGGYSKDYQMKKIAKVLRYLDESKRVEYSDSGRGLSRIFTLKSKKTVFKPTRKSRIVESDGRFPFKPNADGDRRFMKGGGKVD